MTSNDEKVKLKAVLVQPRLVADHNESASVVDQKVGDFVDDESWALQVIDFILKFQNR